MREGCPIYPPHCNGSVWRTERNAPAVNAQGAPSLTMQTWRTEQGRALVGFPLYHTFRTRHTNVYFIFLSATAHSLMSSYSSVRRTEQNVRTVNAQGGPTLIRCKPGELSETCGPYERCSRFVNAFTVRTDRKSKMRT